MPSENVTFEGSHGAMLSAQLDRPEDGDARSVAIFAHCFTCSKNLKAVRHISRALTAAGLTVLRFDFTGLGESEGDFSETNFSSNIDDLVHAAAYLEHAGTPADLLIGHSLGGAAVLHAAPKLDSVSAVATIGAPFDPDHVTKLLGEDSETIAREGKATVTLAGRSFTITRQFLDDLHDQQPGDLIAGLRKALLIFHSPTDVTVGVENAANIFEAAKHPKSFISLDGADHLLTDEADARYVGAMIAEWSRRYLGDV